MLTWLLSNPTRSVAMASITFGLMACGSTAPPAGEESDGDDAGESETAGNPTPTPPTTTGETASGGSTTSATEGEEEVGGSPPSYDVHGIPDTPALPCQDTIGMPDVSYIWIANSGQGTISKINTMTIEEEGRYYTKPSGGDPSRTSVNLSGNVAVANRNGGVAMFFARKSDCVDRNGNGSIDTSTGANDILDWDDEECRAWYTPFNYTSQRPVAWAPGQLDPNECGYFNEKLWTSGSGGDAGAGVDVILIDGDNGEVDDEVNLAEVQPSYYGIYGGAVDGEGNFWGSQLGIGSLIRVDRAGLDYDVYPMSSSGYGMTVDHKGQVWTCSYSGAGRFDPESESWDTAAVQGGGGCMEDGQGTLWLASQSLVGVDIDSLDVVATLSIPQYVHGVSIDFQGYVWGVTQFSTDAYRVDPETGDYDTYNGLTQPYTYSDMTGFALANAGGWVPAG